MYQKIREWTARYLPAEMSGIATAIIIGTVGFKLTGNHAISAFSGTWGDNLGYYGYTIIRDVTKSRNKHKATGKKYDLSSFLKNIRDIILEFGPGETFDSFITRPFLIYFFQRMVGQLQIGIFIGEIAANILFYIPTIISYEIRKKLDS
ncbi:MAG: hypothetical protein UT63_C0016G0003 [Candidatus Gottesmanbacteria bacterium GW2011_GWC2_39_8]|uniref:Uncharacterized protein n=1 Tax=Candidatus Gottesmanbacteria bacterium GW2011_GWC2_39_8 TaxID=1618450 RepID=A0A0G0PZC1_9BACT|nr:MAG: hypothetical protein UT63_C0016G0003 [Candidatus Gottesmanbacteria bacterium GW2011_GWC2_39_8]